MKPMVSSASAAPTLTRTSGTATFVALPGHDAQAQSAPHWQFGPQVHVPRALAGQAALCCPHLAGQEAQVQLSPHWQFGPHVHVPSACAGHATDFSPHLAGHDAQSQLSPHWQSGPHVQVPSAWAGQGLPAPLAPQFVTSDV